MPLLPIHHTFGPLADPRQCREALSLLFQPWRWNGRKDVDALRTALEAALGMRAACFATGREALCALLQALPLAQDDEVIVQGYTCIVVPNAVHAAGGTCVYVDIDPATLALDPDAVARSITPRTRAVICQHTFGIPADTERLRAVCDAHKLLLIEDCAHVFPDARGPAAIGRHADAVMFSFGRDKALSGVTGGAILTRDAALAERLRRREEAATHLPLLTVKRLLLYPLLYSLARPLYGIGVGKALLAAARSLRLLVPIVTRSEKDGSMPPTQHALPGACAALALAQLRRLDTINDHRRARTRQYLQACKDADWKPLDGVTPDLPLQKFPLFVRDADAVRRALKAQNIHLQDGWTGCVVCPEDANAAAAGYAPGSDLCAEQACTRILCLPTHPGTSEAQALTLLRRLSPLLHQ